MPPILGRDNFHIIDVHLFYKSVHENARLRAATYLAERAQLESSDGTEQDGTTSDDA